jgi:hypothetical protein
MTTPRGCAPPVQRFSADMSRAAGRETSPLLAIVIPLLDLVRPEDPASQAAPS